MYWFVGIVIGLVFLLQLPLLVDLLRILLPGRSITRLTSNLTSILLVYFMNAIFVVVLGYFLLIFLPRTVGDLYSFKGACHIAFALWMWLNVVVNYHYAVFLHPGSVTFDVAATNGGTGGADAKPSGSRKGGSSSNNRGSGGPPPSAAAAPPRNGLEWQPATSRHCRNCRSCVSYMDHHCPFTNNCVGERNYSYFVLGLTYGTVGLAYAVALSFPAFNDCVLTMVVPYLRYGRRVATTPYCGDLSVHSAIFVAAFAGLLSVSFMCLVQWALLLCDVPTCEVMKWYGRLPVFRFMWQRLVGRKCLENNSRLNVLLLKQRSNPLWFLLPVRNHKAKLQ